MRPQNLTHLSEKRKIPKPQRHAAGEPQTGKQRVGRQLSEGRRCRHSSRARRRKSWGASRKNTSEVALEKQYSFLIVWIDPVDRAVGRNPHPGREPDRIVIVELAVHGAGRRYGGLPDSHSAGVGGSAPVLDGGRVTSAGERHPSIAAGATTSHPPRAAATAHGVMVTGTRTSTPAVLARIRLSGGCVNLAGRFIGYQESLEAAAAVRGACSYGSAGFRSPDMVSTPESRGASQPRRSSPAALRANRSAPSRPASLSSAGTRKSACAGPYTA